MNLPTPCNVCCSNPRKHQAGLWLAAQTQHTFFLPTLHTRWGAAYARTAFVCLTQLMLALHSFVLLA